jgi:hypothetical protein
MFTFISNLLESITHFLTQVILLVIIVLAVALLLLASNRHRNNPYADHTKERIEQQIEAEREAKYNAALERLYLENQELIKQGR